MKLGRPILGDNKMDKRIDIRFDTKILKEIEKMSKKLGVSRTQFIRDAVNIYLIHCYEKVGEL